MDQGVVLVERKYPPFKGAFALPGGFVEYGESTEQAVVREIQEETGLKTRVERLVGVYSDPDRDPRGHTVSAVYVLEILGGELRAGSDAQKVGVFSKSEFPKLAFDHKQILKDALSDP